MQNIIITLLLLTTCFSTNASDHIPSYYIENIFHDNNSEINQQYFDLQKDLRGIIYLAHPEGVYEFDGISRKLVPLANNKEAFSLAMDNNGKIYVGGRGEIGVLKATRKGDVDYIPLKATLPEYFKKYREPIVDIEIAGAKVIFMSDNFMFVLHSDLKDSITVVQAPGYFYSSVAIGNELYVIDGMQGLLRLNGNNLDPIKGGQKIISYVMLPYEKEKVLIVSPTKGFIKFNPADTSFQYSELTTNPLSEYEIKSGTALHNGNIALGSVRNGCIVTDIKGRLLYKVSSASGIADNSVYNISQSGDGNIWLGLSQGAGLIYDRNTQETDTLETTPFAAYVRNFSNRKNNSVIFSGNYVNSQNGIQTVNQPESQYHKFHYTVNGFKLSFSCNQYHNREQIKYQYKLEGLDHDWSEWSPSTTCEYTNLNWGDYVFKVRAKNGLEEISQPASYAFRIIVPWYESWWFYSIQIGILLSLLVLAGFLYRSGKSEKMAGHVSGIVVVILFKYVYLMLGPLFALVATGIALFDILTSVIMAYLITPAQNLTNSTFERLLKKEKIENDSEKQENNSDEN
ncbi:hypothetical protein OAO55_03030 [Bacteroidales bacterium]|nr:hypothetical protein [Bacteroidales bacterium]